MVVFPLSKLLSINTKIGTLYAEIETFYTEIETFYTKIGTFYTKIGTFYTEIGTFYTEILTTIFAKSLITNENAQNRPQKRTKKRETHQHFIPAVVSILPFLIQYLFALIHNQLIT